MKKIIALAPMDGITNNAYRMICEEIRNNQKNVFKEQYDFFRFTEFMSCEWYVRQPRKLCRHLLTTQWSTKTIAQIYGWDHKHLLETAIDINKKYKNDFHGIELNIWCPSPKIMSCEAWSWMLRCRPKTLQIIQQISEHITKPFSIKTRTWLHSDDENEQFDFIMEASKYCAMITIHWRNYKQSHSGNVNRDFIKKIKDELIRQWNTTIQIIWNGWLKSTEDWLSFIKDGIDGIMLGQAAMCDPRSLVSYIPDKKELYEICIKHMHYSMSNERYFNQDNHFNFSENKLIQPSINQIHEITQSIKSWNISQEKRYSLIEFRKHLFRYVSGMDWCNEFKRQVAMIVDYQELLQAINNFFSIS